MNDRREGLSPFAWIGILTVTAVLLFLLLCVKYATTDPYEVERLWPLAILTGLNVVVVACWVMWWVVVLFLFDGDAPALPSRAADDDRLRPPTDPPAAPWRPADAGGPEDPWAA